MKCNIIVPQAFKKSNVTKAVNFNFPFYYSINDVFNDLSEKKCFQPKIIMDIIENDNELKVLAEIPGVDKENIDLIIDKDILILKGKKITEKEVEDGVYHMLERNYGYFSRSIRLPFEPTSHDIDVQSKDGVLTLSIKKHATENINERG